MLNTKISQKIYLPLDLKDKKILHHLMINARQPLTTIAKKVHLSKESVQYRYHKLMEKGIILKTYAQINYQKIGYQKFHLLLLLNDFYKEMVEEFYAKLNNSNQVIRSLNSMIIGI